MLQTLKSNILTFVLGDFNTPRSQVFYLYRQAFTCEKKSHGFDVDESAAEYYRLDKDCEEKICAMEFNVSDSKLGFILEEAKTVKCPKDFESPTKTPNYSKVNCENGVLGGILHTHFYADSRYNGVTCGMCHNDDGNQENAAANETVVCKLNYMGSPESRSTYKCLAEPCLKVIGNFLSIVKTSLIADSNSCPPPESLTTSSNRSSLTRATMMMKILSVNMTSMTTYTLLRLGKSIQIRLLICCTQF